MTVAAILKLSLMLGCSFWFTEGKWIDLSYVYENDMVTWGTMTPFNLTLSHEGPLKEAPYAITYKMKLSEHTGTHIDAPIHFSKGGITVDEIPVEKLVGEALVVNVSAKASKDRDYQLSVKDLQMWEEKNGRIPDGGILLILTGYGKYWGDYEKYMGSNSTNTTTYRFPGIHPKTSQWLVDNRKISGVGLDSRSLDFGRSTKLLSHQILLGNNIFGLESVANIEKLPTRGATLYVMPMKIKGGSGGPTRVVANTDFFARNGSEMTSISISCGLFLAFTKLFM